MRDAKTVRALTLDQSCPIWPGRELKLAQRKWEQWEEDVETGNELAQDGAPMVQLS